MPCHIPSTGSGIRSHAMEIRFPSASVMVCGAKGWLHAETPQLKEGDLLEIFVDPNMIEIYANNGEYVLSQAVYGLGETFSYEMEKKPEIYLWNE